MSKPDENKKIMYLIQQVGTLMLMQRNHVRNLGNITFDTIASHCFHVAVIAYCITRMEGFSHADGMRALSVGLLHDLAEARTGDNDFVSKNYTTMDETRAVEDQFSGFDFAEDLKKEIEEYEKRETKLSKCIKDADHIAQMYMEWTLSWQGNKLAEKWFKGDMIHRVPALHTKSAKKLVDLIKNSDPQEWWWNQFVDKGGPNLKHLNG
ncbi:MAG: hypothetical protein BWY19_00672 [bacterium ADurb.Bin212]|nr:MAG: hypothetical protein BWY19_00672 [bacterium ADurb.Bin212]